MVRCVSWEVGMDFVGDAFVVELEVSSVALVAEHFVQEEFAFENVDAFVVGYFVHEVVVLEYALEVGYFE